MGKEIETKFSVYRLWNLCDEGVVPCQSISIPYSPSRSPTLTWGCRCRTQWEWSMLMFALGVEVTHFGCIHKERITMFFQPQWESNFSLSGADDKSPDSIIRTTITVTFHLISTVYADCSPTKVLPPPSLWFIYLLTPSLHILYFAASLGQKRRKKLGHLQTNVTRMKLQRTNATDP